jgi:hypothetical protein
MGQHVHEILYGKQVVDQEMINDADEAGLLHLGEVSLLIPPLLSPMHAYALQLGFLKTRSLKGSMGGSGLPSSKPMQHCMYAFSMLNVDTLRLHLTLLSPRCRSGYLCILWAQRFG